MKHKFLKITFSLLLGGVLFAHSDPVEIIVGIDDHSGTSGGYPRTPINVPTVDLTGSTLTLPSGHADFALQLLDEDGEIVYSVNVPSATTTVNLPSWLSGEYELRLYPTSSSIYFFGWIEL